MPGIRSTRALLVVYSSQSATQRGLALNVVEAFPFYSTSLIYQHNVSAYSTTTIIVRHTALTSHQYNTGIILSIQFKFLRALWNDCLASRALDYTL